MDDAALKLNPSEKRTLQDLAQGEFPSMLIGFALQHLKALGLVEERSTGMAVTDEGGRAMRRLT